MGTLIDESYKNYLDKITTKELSGFSNNIIKRLEQTNFTGETAHKIRMLINEIKHGKFDDFHENSYPLPRMELVKRLKELDLNFMAKGIMNGVYDE